MIPLRFPVCLCRLSHVSSGTVVRLNLVRSLNLRRNVSVRSETSKIVAFAVYASVTPDRITVNGLLLAKGKSRRDALYNCTPQPHNTSALRNHATKPHDRDAFHCCQSDSHRWQARTIRPHNQETLRRYFTKKQYEMHDGMRYEGQQKPAP
jgi:hypothetical protein